MMSLNGIKILETYGMMTALPHRRGKYWVIYYYAGSAKNVPFYCFKHELVERNYSRDFWSNFAT